MTTGDFDKYYSDEPWSIMDKNQREWYDPELMNQWRLKSVFRNILNFTKNLGDVRATSMTVTELLDPHPDFTALAARQIWMPAMHIDSRAVTIAFQHNGAKTAYHKYDDMITYWKQNGKEGIRRIMQGALGQSEVDINDLLARNALIKGSFTTGYNIMMGGGSDFNDIGVADKLDPDMCSDIWLGMANRGVNMALGPNGADGSIVCYTSPGVIYDIQNDSDWISRAQYLQDRVALMNYEVGAFKNVRFVQTPKCTLWNCGEIIARGEITASHTAGDGCSDTTKVDGTYLPGQDTTNIKHYITVGNFTSGSMGNIAVNDIITIHKTTTNAYGITGGVDFNEGTAMNRRVVAINSGSQIVLDMPIMVDYDTDLGGGVYGYVTLGRNVHASIFVGGPQAIVAGVAQPPRFYEIDPVDDYKAIYRFTWDQYLGYQPFRPELFEVVFSAGTTRVKGDKKVQ